MDRLAATMQRYAMIPAGRRIGVAVSGGADSVFLLHALHELGLAATVLHINHGLRGAESDGDEEFVRGLATRRGLSIHVFIAPVFTGNTEQEARRFRYEFFAERIAAGHCEAVATGHTLDDQAETVLYRFLRGAGTAGLSGIHPVTESGIVRPLIELRRDEIRTWLEARGLAWREDRSNLDEDFARNRIRLRHLPDLAASLNPALAEVLAATATWARGEEDYWDGELSRLEAQYLHLAPETVLIRTEPFLELPAGVQRRLLRRGIARVRGSLRAIDFRHIEAMRAMMETCEGSGRMQLPGLDIYRSFDWLRLAPVGFDSRLPRDFETPLAVPGRTSLAERRLTIEMQLVRPSDVYNGGMEGLDWGRCAGSLLLRNWRPGDQYHPRGRSGGEKIKSLFQEFRVPLWERRTWPVIARGDSILWTRRFGVAREFAASPASRDVLVIREVMESNPAFSASMNMKRARVLRRPGEPGAEVL
jgi:tRNA(Ile)-lysidine synthase